MVAINKLIKHDLDYNKTIANKKKNKYNNNLIRLLTREFLYDEVMITLAYYQHV
jgi:hypothetical protein